MANIRTVGVIGAGQMGSGIAHVCALAGYDVLVHDVAPERIAESLKLINRNLSRQVARGIVSESDMDGALSRIRPAESLAIIGATDLAIEAATENEEVKKQIFRALQPHLSDSTLLASNTSSISITRLASATDRPERFIGLHFMNPVPLMKLVEIIRGIATDAGTYEVAVAFAKSLGKTTANAEDFPAFIVKILSAKVGAAIRPSADILPSITAHIFLGYKVLLEVRDVLSNFDDTDRWVHLGPDASVSLKVRADTGGRVVCFSDIICAVLKTQDIDVGRHFR